MDKNIYPILLCHNRWSSGDNLPKYAHVQRKRNYDGMHCPVKSGKLPMTIIFNKSLLIQMLQFDWLHVCY